MAKPRIKPLLVAPDSATAAHVSNELERAGLTAGAVFDGSRGWFAKARKDLAGNGQPLVVLVPSAKLRRAQLEVAELATAGGGGALLTWSVNGAEATRASDDWVIDRLLEQRGAITAGRLPVLIQIARILAFAGLDYHPSGVRVKGRTNALLDRLRTALGAAGIEPWTGGADSGIATLSTTGGEVRLAGRGKASLSLADPDTTAEALSLLIRRSRTGADDGLVPFEIEQDVVDLIVQPPARLLSETASKRLLAAFGIPAGPERLCSSPTEATRFAAKLAGPVVLKLVRPALEAKQEAGAVATRVDGGAAVRRAFQSLGSLAERLGPPAPLGVLVAEQIDGGTRVWIAAQAHDRFGNLLLLGSGDSSTSPPRIALTTPTAVAEVTRALEIASLTRHPDETRALALAVTRFGELVDRLGARIFRAEIHPLVAVEGQELAFALDGIVGISD